MDQPSLASIILPNYNHARTLGAAIQSALAQDYPRVEVIVVDDGSTDDSRQVIEEFGEQVRYLWQENGGLSAARNTGLRYAGGAFITVLDADDLLEPGYLSAMVAALQARPQAAGAFCGYRFVDEDNRPLPQVENRPIPPEALHTALLDGNFLVPECVLLRRETYAQVGEFDPALRSAEDWDLWLRVTRTGALVHVDQVLTRHRVLPGSMSANPARMLQNRLAVLDKLFGGEPDENDPANSQRRRAYGRTYLSGCVEYLQAGDREAAFQAFRKLAGVAPLLLTQLDTFYQLGLGAQPKGYLDNLATLDIEANSKALLEMLDRLYVGEAPAGAAPYRRQAYGIAYAALARLAYGGRRFALARRFGLAAIRHAPRLALDWRLAAILLKSLAGPRLVERLRPTRAQVPASR